MDLRSSYIEKKHVSSKKGNGIKTFFLSFLALSLLVPGLFFAAYYFQTHNSINSVVLEKDAALLADSPEGMIVNENKKEVRGEEDANLEEGKVLVSENFKMKQVSLGGDVLVINDSENLPIEIYDIKSESFLTNKQDETKLVISWKTNKMAISELEYARNSGQNPKKIKEQSYGFNHSIILSELEPRTSYVYAINCKDHWGNEKISNHYGVYTSAKPVSVFDMISKAMDDVFGWAIKR